MYFQSIGSAVNLLPYANLKYVEPLYCMDFCATPAVSIAMTKEALALLHLTSRDTKIWGNLKEVFAYMFSLPGRPWQLQYRCRTQSRKNWQNFGREATFSISNDMALRMERINCVTYLFAFLGLHKDSSAFYTSFHSGWSPCQQSTMMTHLFLCH